MELNELIIKKALLEKGVTASTMCKEIGYSQTSLYNFFESGVIREGNKRKIIEYLGLKEQNISDSNVKKIENLRETNVSDNLIDRLLNKIESLTIENFTLKSQLGKFRGTSLALTT